MDKKRKDELKKYFGKVNEPVAIVDDKLTCVYSNSPKLLPEGNSVGVFFQGSTSTLLTEPAPRMAVLNGVAYSVRITPIDNDLYVCDFLDAYALAAMASNTDVYNKIFPIIDCIEYNTALLWQGTSTLKDTIQSKKKSNLDIVLDMEKRLISLNSCSKNISEYINMLKYTPRKDVFLNLAPFAEDIVNRCNTVLSDSGRCVEYFCEEKELFIKAEKRHALCALVNAIQNALVYSTRDCVPCLTITKLNKTKNGEALIRLVNNSSIFIDRQRGDKPSVNFVGQRIGFGLPIIKRFAELAGGKFTLNEQDGQYTTLIELPLIGNDYPTSGEARLSSGGYDYYQTAIPDIVELKMREVINLFIK